jgi:hypothetical protein
MVHPARMHVFVADVAPAGAGRLILESRESSHEEPVLWAADAIAWAVGAGGDRRRRVDPLLLELVRLAR